MTMRRWMRRTMSPRGRSKGAVSISAKTIKHLLVARATGPKDLSDHISRSARCFRGDIRVPYCFFEELVALAKQKRLVLLLQTKMIRTIYSSSFCRVVWYTKYRNNTAVFAHSCYFLKSSIGVRR